MSKAHLKCALIAMNHRGPANGNASEEDALGVMGVGVVAVQGWSVEGNLTCTEYFKQNQFW